MSSAQMNLKLKLTINETFSIFILTSSLFHHKLTVTGTTNPDPKDCEPKSCGPNLNISYPFWLEDQQPSYCGYPPLKLTCKDNTTTNPTPILSILNRDFYIRDIFYENRSFLITPAEFANNPCPFPFANITVKTYPFTVNNSNAILFFLVNCSTELNGHVNINCDGDGKFDYFGGLYERNTELNLDIGSCQFVEVPTISYSEVKGVDFVASLRDGFVVDWDLPVCGECKESGGTCGYDNLTDNFMCMCSDKVHKISCKKSKKKLEMIIGSVAAAGVILILAIVSLLYKKKRGRKSPSSKSLIQNSSTEHSLDKDGECLTTHLFSYEELAEATNGFDSARELGDGGFGSVYKGELRDGRIVAIKRLYENNYRRLEQFMNEVEILSTLRHPNLVNLYGCTSRHSRELLLVYEFVPNGTIADHLHGSRAVEGILTWPLRLSIAIETADALAYLHAVNPPIIHRDVKTTNILLDSNFHVKVADFGLSRLFPNDVTHVSTAPQGTPGYVDPEYHQCYQLTDKSDVYSFGVVLIELISSKPAVDITRQRSEIILANLAITKIQNGEVEQLVDMSLGYNSDSDIRKMITMVAELAFRCLQPDGDMRPPIKEVLDALRTIQGKNGGAEKKRDGDARTRDDARLLKNVASFSPDSVINNWTSRTTTPNSSG